MSPAGTWLAMSPTERQTRAREAVRNEDAAALSTLTEAFLTSHRGPDRIPSPHTLRAYRHSVELAVSSHGLQSNSTDLQRLIDRLFQSGKSPSTLKVRVAGLRALFHALQWAGAMDRDPLAEVSLRGQMPRLDSPREPYTREEIKALAAAADPVDRVLILLPADAGLTLTQSLELEWTDVDLVGGSLWLSDHGRIHTIALSPQLAEALAALPQPHEGRVLSYRTGVSARQRLQRLCRKANVEYRGVHELRPERRASDASRETAGVSNDAVALPQSWGVIRIQVQNLADIETRLGKEAASGMIQQIRRRLERARRPNDAVSSPRNGDLMIAILDLPSPATLNQIAERIKNNLIRPIQIGEQEITPEIALSLSIGSNA